MNGQSRCEKCGHRIIGTHAECLTVAPPLSIRELNNWRLDPNSNLREQLIFTMAHSATWRQTLRHMDAIGLACLSTAFGRDTNLMYDEVISYRENDIVWIVGGKNRRKYGVVVCVYKQICTVAVVLSDGSIIRLKTRRIRPYVDCPKEIVADLSVTLHHNDMRHDAIKAEKIRKRWIAKQKGI